jgi:ribosomal protein S18 acetylase RimI-like enzyme
MRTTITPDIRRCDATELDVAATILAAAFQDDPILRWCLPDDERRTGILPTFFSLVGHAIGGYDEVYVTTDGAAMWVPPGAPAVPEADGPAFEQALADLLGPDADRTFELVGTMEEHHPHDEHHYLWFLGVAPGAQGRGIGSQLLRHVLTTADRTGTPAYLEATSPENVRLYERHGFEVVRELRAAGSPPLTAMWREPQPLR